MNKRYTKKLITAFIVIALIAIIMVCCMAFVMPKNEDISTTSTITTNSESVSCKYPINSKNSVLIEAQSISENVHFTSFLQNNNAEEFTYYIHADANVTNNYTFLPLGMQFGNYIDDNSSPTLQIKIKSQTEIGVYYVEYLADIYNENYVFSYEANIFIEDNIFDYYLVFTNESIAFCYYKPTGGNGAIITPANKFESALNNKVIEFYVGSEEYNTIINLFKNENLFCSYGFTLGQYDEIYNNFVMTQHYKEYAEFDIPPREGYTLKGLYYDEAFTQPYTGDPVKPLDELYLKWEINTYTVTFDCRTEDDQLLDLIEKTYTYGESVDYIPTRENYDFVCWINDANNQEFDGIVKGDMYLMAKWETHKLKVIYVEEDGSVLYEQRIEIGSTGGNYYPRKVGYKFVCWKEFDNLPIYAEETTFTAVWQVAKIKITLFINNNVYKAYEVDYDMPLADFLNEIGIEQKAVAKHMYTDYSGANTPINELLAVKDIRLDLSDSYFKLESFKLQVKANSKMIALVTSSIGLLILVSIFGAIFGKKHKRKKKKQ